jgi:bifunctional NMN adenylyltransferase/nudix hydrolase
MWEDKMIETPKKEYDYCVFIGRLEPPHVGHLHVIKEAFSLANHVIILTGSKNRPRSIKNPWTVQDREIMIDLAINEVVEGYGVTNSSLKFTVRGINDYVYNDQMWAQEVQKQVARIIYTGNTNGAFSPRPKVCLIGHRKDESSFYLDLFPQWDYKEVSSMAALNASDLRTLYFEKLDHDFSVIASKVLPKSVVNYLSHWRETDEFACLLDEYKKVKAYKESWQFALFPPKFIAADAAVIQSGHILLIKRGHNPGKGNWAMPGGFLDENETLRECCLRELKEEAGLEVNERFIVKHKIYDHPSRDLRGRMVTEAYLIELPNSAAGLPEVKAADDAAEAKWVPLCEFEEMADRGQIFSDHSDIIFNLIGRR